MGLLKVLGGLKVRRLPLFGGTVATRKWSPSRSPALGRVSSYRGYLPHPIIIYALAALCIAADVAIWRISA